MPATSPLVATGPRLFVRRAAVLGAGVMGAQIAAHLANAGVEAVLFDLAAAGGDPDAGVRQAVDALRTLDPSPLATAAVADTIKIANYDQHLALLADCDLVIEAIAERIDWKRDLYRRIAPYIGADTILASNTSGLSIQALGDALPTELRSRFCGVHFFNPPRYMHLVELIATAESDSSMLDRLEAFLVTALGKGVVRARDTPNFIANRVGVFSILAAFHHTRELGLGFDEIDAITGTLLGRPKSATYRTADVVGLDTLGQVIGTMHGSLPDDPWWRFFQPPGWYRALLDRGALGQKSGAGIYRKQGRDIFVLDPATLDYRPATRAADPAVVGILKLADPAARLEQLRADTRPQAQFLWRVTRDMLHYCAVHLEVIADNARDLDLAVRWGFGWRQGPFEHWQSAGWQRVACWLADDIAAGRSMAAAPLPAWVLDPAVVGVHTTAGSWSPATRTLRPRPVLPVYRRQPVPDRVLGEDDVVGTTLFETPAVRCWTLRDDIAILSFKSRMHAIGDDVLDGVNQAIEVAERDCRGLVIWQTEPPFSVGANLSGPSAPRAPGTRPSALGSMVKRFRREAEAMVLKAARSLNVADALMAGRLEKVEAIVTTFQETSLALRYCAVPTVAAVDGMALGGGCEFIMHCDRAVATLESYIGLVETGVGLIPAGGGCKELAMRAAAAVQDGDLFGALRGHFQSVATAQVGRSAVQARELGFLRPSDPIIMNRFELLHVALSEVMALAEAGYRPPLPARRIAVAGRSAIATFKAHIVNLRGGEFICEHDQLVAGKLAFVMCGGDVDGGSLVDEAWLLRLEREAFMELVATEKTQARIEHTLETGKPLRN